MPTVYSSDPSWWSWRTAPAGWLALLLWRQTQTRLRLSLHTPPVPTRTQVGGGLPAKTCPSVLHRLQKLIKAQLVKSQALIQARWFWCSVNSFCNTVVSPYSYVWLYSTDLMSHHLYFFVKCHRDTINSALHVWPVLFYLGKISFRRTMLKVIVQHLKKLIHSCFVVLHVLSEITIKSCKVREVAGSGRLPPPVFISIYFFPSVLFIPT